MILLAAIVVAICLRAPDRSVSHEPPAAPAPAVAPSGPPAASARVETEPPQAVGTLMASGLVGDVVEMVPGKAPSERYPAGTMWIGAVVAERAEHRKTRIYEWDVARAVPIEAQQVELDDSNGKINPGDPTAIRLSKDGDKVISLVEATGGAYGLSAEGWTRRTGSRASIAGEAGLVAVAYSTDASSALEIELFHPSFYGADVLGHTRVDADKLPPGQRPAALAFLHGKLYVATRPNAFETVVAELHIPSLRVVNTYRHRRSSTRHPWSRLFVHAQTLYLLDRGELVELPEYAIGGVNYQPATHGVDTDEVAVHYPNHFLTTGGLHQSSTRGDFVPALGTTASCTPAWSPEGEGWPGPRIDAFPMLACSVAGGGVQIVRLPRPPKSPAR